MSSRSVHFALSSSPIEDDDPLLLKSSLRPRKRRRVSLTPDSPAPESESEEDLTRDLSDIDVINSSDPDEREEIDSTRRNDYWMTKRPSSDAELTGAIEIHQTRDSTSGLTNAQVSEEAQASEIERNVTVRLSSPTSLTNTPWARPSTPIRTGNSISKPMPSPTSDGYVTLPGDYEDIASSVSPPPVFSLVSQPCHRVSSAEDSN
jgi:hypothetical protein